MEHSLPYKITRLMFAVVLALPIKTNNPLSFLQKFQKNK